LICRGCQLTGNGSIAQSILSHKEKGDFFSINWGWGIGVMMGVLIAGRVSGAHLNPAVTLSMAIFGRFAWIKVLFYWAAQYLGALAAAASVLGVYSGNSFKSDDICWNCIKVI